MRALNLGGCGRIMKISKDRTGFGCGEILHYMTTAETIEISDNRVGFWTRRDFGFTAIPE
jgi:hypothetical protein